MKLTPTGRYAVLLTILTVTGLDAFRTILFAVTLAAVWNMMTDRSWWTTMGGHPQDFPPDRIYDMQQKKARTHG